MKKQQPNKFQQIKIKKVFVFQLHVELEVDESETQPQIVEQLKAVLKENPDDAFDYAITGAYVKQKA